MSNVFHNLLRAADHGFWLVDPPFMIANRNYDETPPNSAPIEAKNSPLDATCFEFHFDEAIAIFDMLSIRLPPSFQLLKLVKSSIMGTLGRWIIFIPVSP